MGNVKFLKNELHHLPFSSAASIGDLILLSGEIGITDGGTLAGGLVEQARQALENIERTLARLGCGRANIVKCSIMLKDMSRWSEFNQEYLAFFQGRELPARSAFGVSALAFDAEVEIECTAIRDSFSAP